ncbi:nuclear transport factor 2 family protein [Kordiimonas pumila]|uniref:Nuclear transport factor 2 family protein n=1 Tax=Kordiimonas pumila TaxID=2161677 RepID=A0ABV7D0W7_9PROT|nr:nuclear transport factor 2 family protein [Kordiimonas pumila]
MDYQAFAEEWIAAWNSHDLDRIMAHYADDVRFRSPRAQQIVGVGEVVGKPALRAYWGKALALVPNLHFTLSGVYSGYDCVAIHYTNEKGVAVVESIMFGPDGLVSLSAGCYAAKS